MKKLLLSLFLTFCMATSAFAFADATNYTLLTDTSATELSDYSLTSGAAVTSAGVKVRHNAGYAILLITEDKSGGAGDVDIYAQYSLDNTTFYRPYTSNMSGTITQEGNIVTGLQNVTRYIVFTVRMANYINFVFDPDADSEITAKLLFLEDR